jgi:HAD superfamily hydrolase (TIGR01549 family)
MSAIKAVVFDIGETVLDDSREFAAWAKWLGVPTHTFSAVWGAARAYGMAEADIFRHFQPDFDLDTERHRREAAGAGAGEHIDEYDLYPDARPAMARLKARGLRIVIAGNQTAVAANLLRTLNLPADAIGASAEWGVRKPDRGFFDRIVDLAGGAPATILHVGDRPDRDIFPARDAGLRTAWLRRGVQGFLAANDPTVTAAADFVITSLTELADLITPGPDPGQPLGVAQVPPARQTQ